MLPTLTSQLTRSLLLGLSFGVAFNPVTALVGSVVAAAVGALSARRGGHRPWWLLVTLAAWVIGDGVTVLTAVSALLRGGASGLLGAAAPAWSGALFLGVWAVTGLAVGYVLPAWIGIKVGERVTFGTGWLAAAAVAGTLCLAFVALSGVTADMLRDLAV